VNRRKKFVAPAPLDDESGRTTGEFRAMQALSRGTPLAPRAPEAIPRDPAPLCCGKTIELEELSGNRFGERRTCAMGGVAGFLS
jgi:hypothetical protein